MKAVFRHELGSYFTGLTGYVFAGFLLLFTGIYTMGICLSSGYANFEYVLGNMSFTFMLIVPVLTMRVISAERKQKTDNLLYSLPLTMTDVVLGKYLAMLAVFAVPTLIIGIYPLILRNFGAVNLGTCYTALGGYYLLGAALIAVGMFLSSLTDSQAASAGICFAVMLVNYFLVTIAGLISVSVTGTLIVCAVVAVLVSMVFYLFTRNISWTVTLFAALLSLVMITYLLFPDSYSGLLTDVMKQLSLFDRFETTLDGLLDLTTFVYFVSVAAVFVALTVHAMDRRRWAE